jgi:pyruvate carboxylase subunit B
MIADNIWDMMLGKSGKLPGELAPELVKLAKEQGREFYTGVPQDLYPDALDDFRLEMKKNNWELGEDDEELFELAMHPEQYRAYKSGDAKRDFEEDLAMKKAESELSPTTSVPEKGGVPIHQPRTIVVNVGNEEYIVNISYPDSGSTLQSTPSTPSPQAKEVVVNEGQVKTLLSPLEGKFYFTKDSSETPIKVGDIVAEGTIIGYIESMKTYNAIAAEESGRITEICFANGDSVDEDDVLIKLV